MEMINKFYYRVSKEDLLPCLDSKIYRSKYIRELLEYIDIYEKENNSSLGSFYIHTCSNYHKELLNFYFYPLKQETLVNAYIQSLLLGKEEMAEKISLYMTGKEFAQCDFDCGLFNYILEHSMDIDEFLNGEKEKLIFDEHSHQFVMDYISRFCVDDSKLLKKAK
jgi:hypothetical protein